MSVKIELDPQTLQPLVARIVAETLEQLRDVNHKLPDGRIAYPEAEAAALLGIAQHVLRDSRRRGEIGAKKLGKRWLYFRGDLEKWFRNR